jgi:putative tricarboxylic transport membrane protein
LSGFFEVISYFWDFHFVWMVFIGSVAGLFVGAIPGLSVSMATALLVSITYSWNTGDAIATIMGVYTVGVFSGAISAILINIPGAPSSVVTTLDGYPLAKRGEAYKALKYATVYSFIGTLFGIVVLWLAAKPISDIAIKFTPMDYFLIALFGLAAVGSLTAKSFSKGLISAMMGLIMSTIGIDSVMGTLRMTFGIYDLQAGINIVPALVGLFGFNEVLSVISDGLLEAKVSNMVRTVVKLKDMFKYLARSMYYAVIGTLVGALPGAGGPVAAFLAYGEAKRIVKNPDVPFGEGQVEGIVASETANNACIGGAFIPMLTLAVPGDAVTAIILSVFYIHGLQPGPMFIKNSPDLFHAVLAGGLIGSVFILILGLLLGPRVSRIINIPKRILLPIVTVLCVIGAFACNNRMFDVGMMFFFGILGYLMRRRGYPVAPMILALVLGGMMDNSFRRAISLASTEENMLMALFGRPITIVLTVFTIITVVSNIPAVKCYFDSRKGMMKHE